jgi:hypothetical protein
VGTNPAAIFIRLRDNVGADRDKSTQPNLEFSIKSDRAFGHPAIPRAITSAAEDQNHWILPLQFRDFPALRGVVGKLKSGKTVPGTMSDRMQITRQLHVCRQAPFLRLAAVISADCVARTAQGENRQTPGTNEVILLVIWTHILDPIESCVRDDSCADPIRDARTHPLPPRIPG